MFSKVADAAEHAAIAQSPHVEIQHQGILEGIAGYLARLSATRAVVAVIVCFARRTHVFLLRDWGHPVWLLFPLLKLLESMLYLSHTACKVAKKTCKSEAILED